MRWSVKRRVEEVRRKWAESIPLEAFGQASQGEFEVEADEES